LPPLLTNFLQVHDYRITASGDTSIVLRRRAILLVVLVASLAAPVAAWAQPADQRHGHDGSLSIERGKGKVNLQATGAVIGTVRKGKVKIKIYKGKHGQGDHGQVMVLLRGKGTVRHKQDGTVVYKGRHIRIKIVDKKFRVQINGVGINISSVAQGTCTLQASPTAVDPGNFSLDGGDTYQPLPQDSTTYQLGSS
jgi:hypothetical protein